MSNRAFENKTWTGNYAVVKRLFDTQYMPKSLPCLSIGQDLKTGPVLGTLPIKIFMLTKYVLQN